MYFCSSVCSLTFYITFALSGIIVTVILDKETFSDEKSQDLYSLYFEKIHYILHRLSVISGRRIITTIRLLQPRMLAAPARSLYTTL